MKAVDWIIFYEDGHFSSEEGTPWDAPRQGVQIIAQHDDFVGYTLVHGEDFFYYEKERGGWVTGNQFTMYDHLMRAPKPLILFGRMMSDKAFQDFRNRVIKELGPKQGWTQRELRNGKVPE